MNSQKFSTNFDFLADQHFAVSKAQPLGNGWESSSFDGSHIISSELSEKTGRSLKLQIVNPSTLGPHVLRWTLPLSGTHIKGRWVLSFYARTKKEVEVSSSLSYSKDETGAETAHHIFRHSISRSWRKFISVIHLDDKGVFNKTCSLSFFLFLPKDSVFNLELAQVEVKKESCMDVVKMNAVKGCQRSANFFMAIASALSLFFWQVSKMIFKKLWRCTRFLLEKVYRYSLWFSIHYQVPQQFSVLQKSLWIFDKDLGFNYPPEEKIGVVVFNGKNVVARAYHYHNSLGNVGHDDGKTYNTAKLRILTFGDSFTVGTGGVEGGSTWPDLLRKSLKDSLHSEVSVVNFARDGTGLLSMFDVAAAKVPEWKPDFFIIAFISGDLPRGRFWRTSNVVNGFERILVSADDSPNPNPDHSADVSMVNSRLTDEWVKQRMGKKLKPDAVVKNVIDQYRYIRQKAYRHINLWDPSRNFLEQKMLHNDPFYGLTPQYTNCPPFKGKSYAEDEKTVRNIQILKETGIPMILVHLPTVDTFDDPTDSYVKDPLFECLSPLCGSPIIKLKNYYSESLHGPMKELFRLKYNDGHYSEAGLKFTADELNKILLKVLPSSKSFMKRWSAK